MTDENQDQLIHQILASGGAYDDLLHRPLLEATRQIARGVSVSASLRIQVLDDVMELWKNPPFLPLRAVINEIFSGITHPEFADEVSARLLAHCVQNPIEDWGGAELARIAGKLGKREEAAAFLLEQSAREIEDVGDEDDIIEAAVALGEIGEKEKAASVLLGLLKDLDQSSLAYALESLIQLNTSSLQSKNALSDLACDAKTSVYLRVATARSLVKLNESQQAIPVLREIALHRDGEDAVRRRTARGLGEAGEQELAISVLLEVLHDSRTHKVVACHAAEDLVRLGQRETGLQFLTSAAQPEASCVICDSVTCGCGREFIAEKLVELGERELTVSLLTSALQNSIIGVSSRVDHASMLARLGKTREAVPILIKAMRSIDPSDYAYSKAVAALGKYAGRDEEVLGLLLSIAQNKNIKWSGRWRAIEALGNYGDSSPRVLEFLAEIARINPDTSLRRTACEALWKLIENSNVRPEQNKC